MFNNGLFGTLIRSKLLLRRNEILSRGNNMLLKPCMLSGGLLPGGKRFALKQNIEKAAVEKIV